VINQIRQETGANIKKAVLNLQLKVSERSTEGRKEDLITTRFLVPSYKEDKLKSNQDNNKNPMAGIMDLMKNMYKDAVNI